MSAVVCCSFGLSAAFRPRAIANERLAPSADYIVTEKSVATLEADLARRRVTAVALAESYLARIRQLDVDGPALQSIVALNPSALEEARRSDLERAAGKRLGTLAGIPVLIKDNIEAAGRMPTTAGSKALAANVSNRDAPLVARLRAAGAIVLGKTNLSEWANFRSSYSLSGWSAVGGLVKNPYALDRSACGSSSGTAAAIAASFSAVGIGTETDGSITCPAATNGLVGLKPTLGLVSRTNIVPISHDQDTAGPIGRSVADVAALLTVIAGTDPRDPATKDADRHKTEYVAALRGASLKGRRLGVLRYAAALSPPVMAVFDRAVALLREQGARIVELPEFKPDPALGDAEMTVLLADFKVDVDAYLATTPATVRARSLAALIAFDRRDPTELGLFGQDLFEKAQATKGTTSAPYLRALRICRQATRRDGIDRLIASRHLDALIAPTGGPAWRVDAIDGDNASGSFTSLPAVAGYPHLTVPMGFVTGLPVGISFIGGAWSEAELLALGAAYERAARARRPPSYLSSIERTPSVLRLLASSRSASVNDVRANGIKAP